MTKTLFIIVGTVLPCWAFLLYVLYRIAFLQELTPEMGITSMMLITTVVPGLFIWLADKSH